MISCERDRFKGVVQVICLHCTYDEAVTYLLDMSGYRCGQTGANASASLVPGQAGGGGGGASLAGCPA